MSSPNRKPCQNIHAPKKLFLSYARNDIDSIPRTDAKEVSNQEIDNSNESDTKSVLNNTLLDVPLDVTTGQPTVSPWNCIEGLDFPFGSSKIIPHEKDSIGNVPAFQSQLSAFKSESSSVLPEHESASICNTSNVICPSTSSMSAYDRLEAYTDDGQPDTDNLGQASNLSMDVLEKLASESSLSLEDINYITTSPHIPNHIKRIVLVASVSSNMENDQDKMEIVAGMLVDPDLKQLSVSRIYNNVSTTVASKMVADLSKVVGYGSLNKAADQETRQNILQIPVSHPTQYSVPRNRQRLWKGRSDTSSFTCQPFTSPDLSSHLSVNITDIVTGSGDILNLDTDVRSINRSSTVTEDFPDKPLSNDMNENMNPKLPLTVTDFNQNCQPTFDFSGTSSTECNSNQATNFSSASNSFELYEQTPTISDPGYGSDCVPVPLSQPSVDKREINRPSFFRSEFSGFFSDNVSDVDILRFSGRNSSGLALNNDSNFIEDLSSKETVVSITCSIPSTGPIEDCDINSSVVDVTCKKDDHILINEKTDIQFESCDVSYVRVKEEIEIASTDTCTNAHEKGNGSGTQVRKPGHEFDLECQVCGDTAASFYCGAYICEACKKFFLRACKQAQVKYVCFKVKSCSVTKENRIRCQYCRYQKCLKLNMYSPGSNRDSTSDATMSSIPCRVCGAPSSGFHFGALTCEGCKGFFRRMVKECDLQHYQCAKIGLCEVNTTTRNLCKTCRYSKCVKVGMSIEGSRIGRQPNTVKRAISLELQQKLYDGNKNDCYPATRGIIGFSCEKDPVMPAFHYLENRPSCMQFVKTIDNAAKELVPLYYLDNKSPKFSSLGFDTPSSLWGAMMANFEHHAHCVIHFAKKVPGFRAIDLQEQVKLVQGSIYPIYPIVIVTLAQHYDPDNGSYNYFNFSKAEEEHIMKIFPMLRVLQKHFDHVGQIVKIFNFDQVEFAIFSAILLLSSDDNVTTNIQVRDNQKKLVSCLQEYEEKNYTNGLTRFGILLLRLGELSVINQQHNQAITVLLSKHAYLNIPQLYKEMILKH